MGRKNRSASIGNTKDAIRPRSSSLSTTQTSFAKSKYPDIDIDACNALFKHFLHEKDSIGRTFLHHAVHTVSSDVNADQETDGYFLMDAISKRARELDKFAKEKGKGSSVSHLHRLMLTKDEENGYTPLHYAILQRDLTSLLILLKHSSAVEDDDGSTSHHSQQMHHPLRLLDSRRDDEGISCVMKDLAASLDNESLSPLQLLGATSANELEKCRQTIHWTYLKQIWKQQMQSETDASGDGIINHRRLCQRMISFGDERDYLNNDVDDSPADNAIEQRSRSGSFHVHGLDHDDEDDDEEQAAVDNDFLPLGDVDFTLLVEPERVKSRTEDDSLRVDADSVAYGCEVYTFGKSDHCALGVPQFGTSGRRDRRYADAFGSGKKNSYDKSDLSSSAESHKPRRVEAFALGEMRREWSDPRTSMTKEKESVDSPVVAVAAASHHTLAVTRGGRLFAFGLGKGGRLGTGDENHRPLPTRILGPLSKRIVACIAAAENHSLCTTAFDGGCYAWGSNGFGQLGMPSDLDQGSRLSPRRVEDLKAVFVVAVAAGDRHSVALTKMGEVFCWGDNRAGQLGSASSPFVGGASMSPTSSSNRCCYRPQRVEGLWLAEPQRRAIAISASEFSTLTLTRPPTNGESSLASLPVNVVYGWGHGSHVPLRVNFPTADNSSNLVSMQQESSTFSKSSCVNPTSIASSKYHNVAITADGRVYTWGLHAESLGIEKSGCMKNVDSESNWALRKGKSHSHNSAIASPQLVVAMLPENGGGRAVAVSASESHSAIVTADGHLFTWGSSYGNNTLGHKGVKWQPSPRKVMRVHRAVGVAAAKEHTALLIGTSFPCLPREAIVSDGTCYKPLTLKDSVAVEISRNVDVSNVIPVAIVAHRVNSMPLLKFCEKFVEMNLDGVLSAATNTDLESFVANKMSFDPSIGRYDHSDGIFHPILYKLANTNDWMQSSLSILKFFKGFYQTMPNRNAKKQVRSQANKKPDTQGDITNETKKSFDQNAGHPENTETLTLSKESKKVHDSHGAPKFKPPGDASKYHCTVCAVSCPDSSSYTLHMSGRKHRNRLNHTRKEEEKEVAEQMMAMKRMQLMEGNQTSLAVESQESKKQIAKSPAWTSPHNKKYPEGSSSMNLKTRSNSLLGIMKEELQKSVTPGVQATPKFQVDKSKGYATPASGKKLCFSPEPLSKSASSSNTFALSAFITSNSPPIQKSQVKAAGACWAVAKPLANDGPALCASNKTRRFADIQKEESDIRKREDHMCHIGGSRWFVQQRERAASIGDIQQQQKEDADWILFVEEQKRIEEEITRESKIKATQEKARMHRKRQSRKKNVGSLRENQVSET
ncbi:hypothetical protein HJC23_003919 [Cyclotella cryptica]|uniref:U1-type domain-containing protein n=1 Tax=Cyclotella cryptica TaxID=29204 RepID=A0ABD3PV86_9STRA|eukprot:CCRYP_011473-RB/>CCRYP_011473-RB protein AED:0.16 eAED:0.16 QI:548/1/1/1/0.5/0.33/3/134/1336